MNIIQNILIDMFMSDKMFYGYLLQQMKFQQNDKIDTLCIRGHDGQITMMYNKAYLESLKPEERIAVIEHEILHVANNHSGRFKYRELDEFQGPYLVGTDAAINHVITGLPKGLITKEFVEKQLKSEGIITGPIEPNREAEYYVSLLQKLVKKLKDEGKIKGVKGYSTCHHFDETDEEKGR